MRERRNQKLIEPFQYRIAYRILAYWFLYQFALWNMLFCWQLIRNGRGNLVDQYVRFTYDFSPMLVCFLLFVPAFTWDAMKLFHRVAGPVYRVRRTLQDVTAHKPVRMVSLRKGDQLISLRDDVNAMLAELARVGAVQFVDEDVQGVPTQEIPAVEPAHVESGAQELCQVS